MPVRTALSPGVLSPTLPVPKSIPRPEYVGKPTAREGSEPWVQTPEVIEKMRVASAIAAGALAEAGKAVAPGVTTDELDRVAHAYMVERGAYPSTLGYKGYPKSWCTSLNEGHGVRRADRRGRQLGIRGADDQADAAGPAGRLPGLRQTPRPAATCATGREGLDGLVIAEAVTERFSERG
jgi:hypothetical protein